MLPIIYKNHAILIYTIFRKEIIQIDRFRYHCFNMVIKNCKDYNVLAY